MALCAVVEDLDEREASWGFQNFLDIPHARKVADQHHIPHGTIEESSAHHGEWQGAGSVFNFLRC